MLQNATLLRKSAPWPPNISDGHVSCIAPATRNVSLQILFKCPTLAIVFLEMLQNLQVLLTFGKVQNPLRLPRSTTSEPSKVVRACGVLTFWLGNVLRATTACNFSSLIWPHGSAPAALASLLFGSTLRSHEPFEKRSVSRPCYLFVHLHLLFSDSFSTLPTSSFLLFSDSSHLFFSSVHIVRSLTSKLPSIK